MSRSKRLLFIADHPGCLTEIAKECGVSPSLVSLVFSGKRDNEKVVAAIQRYLAKEQS